MTHGIDPGEAYPPPQPASLRSPLMVALEQTRNRLMVTAAVVSLVFVAIGGKLVGATLFSTAAEPRQRLAAEVDAPPVSRADIVDRNGSLLATSLTTQSLYADPKVISRPDEVARKLVTALPDLDYQDLVTKLSSDKRFIWIKRNMSPRQQALIHRLGLPGVYFEREERRFYPASNLTSHLVGFTGVDNNGLAGLEQQFNKRLNSDPKPLRLSVDLRVQHVLRKELMSAVAEFSAIGATGMVYDVRNGEVVAMVSLPDFDPHNPTGLDQDTLFNRASLGVYEMGSTFKIFNTAMALESGKVRLTDSFDASQRIQIGRFTISDFHGKNRWLTVPEVFQYSSNIGSVRMALTAGVPTQRAFMGKMGFTKPTSLELPENGWPLVPNPWRDINAMTISFGHGISVSPVHTVSAAAAMVNGGVLYPPTLLKRTEGVPVEGEQVITPRTSETIRRLFRLVVTEGSAKSAKAPGYLLGGKTGTADKQKGRGYNRNSRISSFLGAFPMNDPRYAVYVMIDEPKGTAKTYGFATGGWVAAPTAGRIVSQIGPMLNVPTVDEASPAIINALYISPSGSTIPPTPATMSKGSAIASVPSPSGKPN